MQIGSDSILNASSRVRQDMHIHPPVRMSSNKAVRLPQNCSERVGAGGQAGRFEFGPAGLAGQAGTRAQGRLGRTTYLLYPYLTF